MKFTNEQLSRILSAHCNRQLEIGEHTWHGEDTPSEAACAIEAATATTYTQAKLSNCTSDDIDDFVDRFDNQYRARWSVDRLLAWLRIQGVM